MTARPFRRLARLAGLLSLAGTLGVPAPAPAQKGGTAPPPPPPPPGTIYFDGYAKSTADNRYYWFRMRMDGGGGGKALAQSGLPSYGRHGGQPAFLFGDYDVAPDGETAYPDPAVFARVFVNGQWQAVQLTSAADGVRWTGWSDPAWGRDDSFVSFAGWELDAAGQARGGIYVVRIDWSTGVPVAGVPALALAATVSYDPPSDSAWVNVAEHDWAPGGGAVAFKTEDDAGQPVWYVARFATGGVTTNRLATADRAEWSPDGTRIAYSRNAVWTVNPDGTNAVRLTTQVNSTKETRAQSGPTWSPDGDYLAYTEYLKSGGKESWSVLRIPTGGGTAVKLTADLAGGSGPAWRP